MATLFSLDTPVGRFLITTNPNTFKISFQTFGCKYELMVGDATLGVFASPYKAIIAVAQHRTGLPEWDESDEQASSCISDWTCHVDTKMKMQLVADYLQRNTQAGYRDLIDYFHFKHPYLMDRMEIRDLLDDLAVTGQLDGLPSDQMVPAEFRRLAERLKRWQDADAKG